MKRYIILFICIIAITGCSKETEEYASSISSINYNNDYYTIYLPYKKGVGENYIINSNIVDFDIETIERDLVQLSTNVFDVNKYRYREGQYLTKKRLKILLDDKHLNNIDSKIVDGKKIKPTIINGIYEKNFLDKNGQLKGISLGIVLNRYQSYDVNNNYVTLDLDEVINYGKNKSQDLIKYIREDLGFKDVEIMVALYVEESPESNVKGNYLYYGTTNKETIDFQYIARKNYYMNSNDVKKVDITNYNNYRNFEEALKEYDNSIYVSGLGYYNGNNLRKLDIVVTKSYYSYGELMYLSQLISENMIKYFKNTKIVVEIHAINDIKAYIVKEQEQTSTDIFIY